MVHRNMEPPGALPGPWRAIEADETRRRGVDKLLCEVQLHLRELYFMKTDGGHKNYKRMRNAKGQ